MALNQVASRIVQGTECGNYRQVICAPVRCLLVSLVGESAYSIVVVMQRSSSLEKLVSNVPVINRLHSIQKI